VGVHIQVKVFWSKSIAEALAREHDLRSQKKHLCIEAVWEMTPERAGKGAN
jgi:hypothetical protein